MNANFLQTPIVYLKGVGPNRAELLRSELGIEIFEDLLQLYPNRYLDKTKYYKISQLTDSGADLQVIGKITHLKNVAQKRGSRLVATFIDETGKMELVWFRGQKWIRENIKLNEPYVIFGKVKGYGSAYSMPHPEMELLKTHQAGLKISMQPIYPSTEKLSNSGITNRALSKLIQQLFLETKANFPESLNSHLISELKLISKADALLNIHFPKSQELLAKAQFRLKFEELFYVQLQLLNKKAVRKHKIKGLPFDQVGTKFNTFFNDYLPFELTNAQKRVIKEIRNDLGSSAQMNRLLQGDVGSGKTIVALMCMLLAIDNDYQTCLMAPTEILANQHYNGLKELLGGMDITIEILTGSVKKSVRRGIHERLESGELHILVGTHALLEDKVQFKNLGFAVIDEQHRFGVAQRSKLWKKGSPSEDGGAVPPHILVMTATPIPRTLAMSLYGDLDISVIDELPPGRKAIQTVHRYDANRLKVFRFIKDEIKKGRSNLCSVSH